MSTIIKMYDITADAEREVTQADWDQLFQKFQQVKQELELLTMIKTFLQTPGHAVTRSVSSGEIFAIGEPSQLRTDLLEMLNA